MTTTVSGSQITFNDNTTQNTSAYGGGFAFRNRIINGDMVIDQRNNGASVTANGNAVLPVDRWKIEDATDGVFTGQQVSDAPTGASYSLKVTITTADTSLGATQYASCYQLIEGYNTADLAWGTANAKTVTLSFWVKSSLTGTFGGSVTNSGWGSTYPFTYTISSANTWEYKTVTIPGSTSGTWLTTNGQGIGLFFGLGVGADYSGTAGAWTTGVKISATGATSVIGTNSATWQISLVQLEKGSTATSFDYRPYGQELALCQRYYYRTTPASGSAFGFGWNASTTVSVVAGSFPVPMRTRPTALEQSGTASNYKIAHQSTETTCSAVPTFDTTTSETIYVADFTVASGLTSGQGSGGRSANAAAYLGFSAEL